MEIDASLILSQYSHYHINPLTAKFSNVKCFFQIIPTNNSMISISKSIFNSIPLSFVVVVHVSFQRHMQHYQLIKYEFAFID